MTTIFEFLFDQYKTYSTLDITLEIVAVIFGFLSVWYSKQNKIWVFPTGMISTLIFVYLLFKWELLGDMMINGYYFIMSIYGWYIWTRKVDKTHVNQISTTTFKEKKISMAVCTNKQEHLAIDLLKKIGIYDYFEYVAGSDTFDYCKPDPRHITSIIEIIGGDIKKSLMFGDSETDANAAKAASVPVILLENGYTEKNSNEIYHNHLIKDFIGVEKIVSTYLKD